VSRPQSSRFGRGHAPAALQVAIEVVVDDAAQGIVGGVFRRASHLRVGGVFVERELHGLEDTARKLAVASPFAPLGGFMKGRAQQGHLGEIVEVPAWSEASCRLSVKLRSLRASGLEVAVALQLDQGADRQNGGCRAAVVHAQGGQFGRSERWLLV
jgi:hypothetical protein